MSQDITFEKEFTIEDVENKTSIKIEYQKGNYWMSKNESSILINTYTDSLDDVEKLKNEGYSIEDENGITYAIKGDEKRTIYLDKGKKNEVVSITRFGGNDLSEILDELVITFQTRFITDDEEQELYCGENPDEDKLYTDATIKYGYKIEDDIISINKNIYNSDNSEEDIWFL